MPKSSDDLLSALWACVERAGDLEEQLRHAADEVAAWQAVARASIAALEEMARRREEDETRTTIG